MNCEPKFLKKKFSGGLGERETPVPIPNTEVKPLSVDGTARVTVWESRTLPGVKIKIPLTSGILILAGGS
jgi:hypothetical protein